MRLDVLLDEQFVGILQHDAPTNQFAFEYAPSWVNALKSFPLSPSLTFDSRFVHAPEQHSRLVRTFFENLLPEGQALDDVAAAYALSKTNTMGLIAILGQETAGALRIVSQSSVARQGGYQMRAVAPAELSRRIRERPQMPFTIWDQKVRLSIAGYQDKIAVYQDEADQWFLVEGHQYASTHILKPEPLNPLLAGLTSNEFFCMRLAKAVGLNVAEVRLHHVAEPVLSITRFDRLVQDNGVMRLSAIDGCQALSLTTLAKYERPYGASRDVREIRTGASLPQFFALLEDTAQPVIERLRLLRWVVFQVLIGNTDAHAKNLSFFNGPGGLSLAPAYDLVAGLVYADKPIEDSFAMAIGDAFTLKDVSPYEWANMALLCGLPPSLVQREVRRLAELLLQKLDETRRQVLEEGADPSVVNVIATLSAHEADRQITIAQQIVSMAQSLR